MPIYTNAVAQPRQEDLGMMIRQGRGANRRNIWRELGPMVPVEHRQGRFAKMDIANGGQLRLMNRIIAPGADLERWTATIGTQMFSILVRAEEVKIPDEEALDWGQYFDIEANAMQIEADRAELMIEFLAAAALFNTSNFGAAVNSTVAYTSGNLATINLPFDIIAGVRRGMDKGESYNTVIIPGKVWDRLGLTPVLLQYVAGTFGPLAGIAAVDGLVKAFSQHGITKVLIANSIFNNGAEGQENLQYIWDQSYIWVGETSDNFTLSENGFLNVEGALAFLYWADYIAGNPGSAEDMATELDGSETAGYLVETYRHETQRSNIVRVKTSTTPYAVDPRRGTLIATQFA